MIAATHLIILILYYLKFNKGWIIFTYSFSSVKKLFIFPTLIFHKEDLFGRDCNIKSVLISNYFKRMQ